MSTAPAKTRKNKSKVQRPAKRPHVSGDVPTTVRLNGTLRSGLMLLKKTLGRPMNKLINDAVADYVERRTAEVELDLEATLAKIKAARIKEPRFKDAIARTARAESALAKDDPVEGKVVLERARGRAVAERG